MKTTIISVLLVAVIVSICHAQNNPPIIAHQPNSGFVGDAGIARGIAKTVVISMSPNEDMSPRGNKVHGEGSYDARLKDGVWNRCRI